MQARFAWLLWIGLIAACDGTGGNSPAGSPPAPTEESGQPGTEICDGYDNNLDGVVDEGCPCKPGEVGECFPGLPGKAGTGPCKKGSYVCAGEVEFARWGACEGAVTPAAEVCGNGIDEDCDGGDLACGTSPPGGPTTPPGEQPPGTQPPGTPPPGTQPPGTQPPGGQPPGGQPPTEPPPTEPPPTQPPPGEQPPNGQPQPPPMVTPVKVPLFFIGDCVKASCPPASPFPVGCQVIFSIGDPRGCVASTPTNPVVYFQAGDQCDKGLVTGYLLCSTQPGAPLNVLSCPMLGKSVFFYPSTPAGCPPVH